MREILDLVERMENDLQNFRQKNKERVWIHKRVLQTHQVSIEAKKVQIKSHKQNSVKTISFLNFLTWENIRINQTISKVLSKDKENLKA